MLLGIPPPSFGRPGLCESRNRPTATNPRAGRHPEDLVHAHRHPPTKGRAPAPTKSIQFVTEARKGPLGKPLFARGLPVAVLVRQRAHVLPILIEHWPARTPCAADIPKVETQRTVLVQICLRIFAPASILAATAALKAASSLLILLQSDGD